MAQDLPKFAIFDYFESETVEVGLVSDIQWESELKSDLKDVKNQEKAIRVRWSLKGAKKARKSKAGVFSAKILNFHDDEQKLRQLCNNFTSGKITIEQVKSHSFNDEQGRGKRKRFAKPESSSDEDEPLQKLCPELDEKTNRDNRNSSSILARVMEKEEQEQASKSLPSTSELEQLRKENVNLRCAITALSYLPRMVDVLKKNKLLVNAYPDPSMSMPSTSQSPGAGLSTPSNKTSVTVADPQDLFAVVTPARPSSATKIVRTPKETPKETVKNDSSDNGGQITDVVLNRCTKSTPQKLVNDLLSAMFSDVFLATHCLGGKSSKESNKDGLPAEAVNKVIAIFSRLSLFLSPRLAQINLSVSTCCQHPISQSEVVRGCFEHEDPARIRAYIRQKLNNADKIMKRKKEKDSVAANSVNSDTEETQP